MPMIEDVGSAIGFSLGQDDAVKIAIWENKPRDEEPNAMGVIPLASLTNVVRSLNEQSRAHG